MLGSNYECTVKKYSKDREYKKHIIWEANVNTSGIKYYCYSRCGTLRSNTLAGIKALITKYR